MGAITDTLSMPFLRISRNCPGCGSQRSLVAETQAIFTVRKPRRCMECKSVYLPANSRLMAGAILVISTGMIAGGLYSSHLLNQQLHIVAAMINLVVVILGCITAFYGLRFLLYRDTNPESSADRSSSTWETSELVPAKAAQIRFGCHFCKAHLERPQHQSGVVLPCPECGADIIAPTETVLDG